jgi:hypothetical protein
MNYSTDNPTYPADALRLEAVTACVGFDDILDVTLGHNHPHVDTMIVVTSHDDKKTHSVCKKHSVRCVQTDLFDKNGRKFNKGAGINAGFGYFQYHGWRMHLDADIILPDSFRRVLFNHSHLDPSALYGVDRIDVLGMKELEDVTSRHQHRHQCLVEPNHHRPPGARYLSPLHGYLPLGYFQLWHAGCHKEYPYSLGSAAHDDTLFSMLWPESRRRLLPSMFVYHLCPEPPAWGQNWEGRKSRRL